MKIQNVIFRSLRVSESLQFFSDVYQLCINNDPVALQIEEQANSLKVIIDKMNSSFKAKRSSELTQEIIEADKRRDHAIVCLRTITEGYSSHFNDENRDAAVLLLNVIDKYGSGISRMNYHAESSILENLGKELTGDETLMSYVEKLGLTDIVNEVIDSNNAFQEKYIERVKDDAGKEAESATGLYKPAIDQYRQLVSHIEAHATLTPSEAYKTLIAQMNELINKFNTMVTIRSGNGDEEAA